ncbi:hypothetical protein [Pseudomonas sp.]|uniref:hypothetical protein n=1 Tax=Pseudomonas sp. TaxID=306 RepID=UPI003F3193C5
MAVPKTIASELIDRLNALSASGEQLSVFEKASFKRDIEALKTKDAKVGFMAAGVFFALTGDTTKSFENHETSLRYSGYHPMMLKNFAISLKHLGYYTLAFDRYCEALKKDTTDKICTLKAAELVSCTGKFEAFETLLGSYIKAAQDEAIMNEYNIGHYITAKKAAQRLKISDDNYNHAFMKAEEVFRKHDVRPIECIANTINSDGHDYLSLELRVKCSGETLAQMNEDMASLVAEDFEFEEWNRMIYAFTYATRTPIPSDNAQN